MVIASQHCHPDCSYHQGGFPPSPSHSPAFNSNSPGLAGQSWHHTQEWEILRNHTKSNMNLSTLAQLLLVCIHCSPPPQTPPPSTPTPHHRPMPEQHMELPLLIPWMLKCSQLPTWRLLSPVSHSGTSLKIYSTLYAFSLPPRRLTSLQLFPYGRTGE